VLEIITDTVTRSRNLIDDVEWSAMDATRTPIDYLCRCVEAAIKCGATTINLPDTVGYATPDEYKAMFEQIRERVPDSDKAIFSVHCHDDLGLAVANSLAGVAGGARQIECTINGLGERAGNAALEEIVMAIRTRGDILPYETQIDPNSWSAPPKWWPALSGFAGPVQQGHRRQERLRPRERHPPGRHAEERGNLRNHAAGRCRRQGDVAGHGQAFRPSRVPRQAEGTGL
jgi:2-isopropylmalate synthase